MFIFALSHWIELSDWFIAFYAGIGGILIGLDYAKNTKKINLLDLMKWTLILCLWWDIAFLTYKSPIKVLRGDK